MRRLEGKVAVITGAAGYIGSATAKLFAAEGARLVCVDVEPGRVQRLVQEIASGGGAASSIVTDVTKEDQIIGMIDFAVSTYGRLDVLHNCAAAGSGLGKDRDVVETPDAEWDWALKIHLYSTIWGCKYAIPKMTQNGGGSIINMSSMLYRLGRHELVATGVAKAGVVALTKYIASSHGKRGIRANAIAPGFSMSPERIELLPARIPAVHRQHALTPRLGRAMDQAQAALFLASDESAYINGQTLEVDGGLGAHDPTMPQLDAESTLDYLKE
jgi:NAD(P)-dependent dehydrogenase (short-subunit alcohol dehydrogenase family)